MKHKHNLSIFQKFAMCCATIYHCTTHCGCKKITENLCHCPFKQPRIAIPTFGVYRTPEEEQQYYKIRQKIYPQAVRILEKLPKVQNMSNKAIEKALQITINKLDTTYPNYEDMPTLHSPFEDKLVCTILYNRQVRLAKEAHKRKCQNIYYQPNTIE